MKVKALGFTVALLIAALPLFAAYDAFLKIQGVDGESTSRGHEGWIEASSFSWGVTTPGTRAYGSGGGEGKCALHEFTITKPIDKASPKLQQDAMSGAPIPSLTLEAGGERHLLQNVVIKSIRPTQAALGDGSVRPAQAITFAFSKCATHDNQGGASAYQKGDLKISNPGLKVATNGLFSMPGAQGAIILQDVALRGNNSAIITVGRGDSMLLPAVHRAFSSKQTLPVLTLSAAPTGASAAGADHKLPYLEFKFTNCTISSVSGNQFTVHFDKFDGPMAGFHDVSIK